MSDTAPHVFLIVAMARNHIIGRGNDLPWHIPEDLKRFKALTLGKPVVLGRKTFESITGRLGKPLPGRPHYVVTRSGLDACWDQVTICKDLEIAVARARTDHPFEDIAIIGGASIYEQAIAFVDQMHLTVIDADIDGDASFPQFDPADWAEIARERLQSGGLIYDNLTLNRK